MLTNSFHNWLAACMEGKNLYMIIGDGTTAVSSSNTLATMNPIAIKKINSDNIVISGKEITMQVEFLEDEACGDWKECGIALDIRQDQTDDIDLANINTDNLLLLNRLITSAFMKTQDFSLRRKVTFVL